MVSKIFSEIILTTILIVLIKKSTLQPLSCLFFRGLKLSINKTAMMILTTTKTIKMGERELIKIESLAV